MTRQSSTIFVPVHNMQDISFFGVATVPKLPLCRLKLFWSMHVSPAMPELMQTNLRVVPRKKSLRVSVKATRELYRTPIAETRLSDRESRGKKL